MYLDPVTNFNHANTTHQTRIRRAAVSRLAAAADRQPQNRQPLTESDQP
jgi:hypothetical protein